MKFKKFAATCGALALTAVMGLSVTGCVNKAPVDDGVFTPPEEWHEESVDKLVMFANDWDQFNTAAKAQSYIYKELKKAVGCDLEAKNTGLETYYTQLDLLRTTHNLPELFLIEGPASPELYRGLIRDREVIPISYYVNEDTKEDYPNLYEYLKQYDYMKKNVTYANGEIWFVPVKWANDKSLYVRLDWVKNLNAKIDDILVADGVVTSKGEITDELRSEYRFSEQGPADLGEFYRLARAFTLYDPDENGKNDTFGYVTEENRDMDSWIHVAYDSPWLTWAADENGNYANTATSEGSMLATSLLNKMTAEGYISEEAGGKTVSEKQNDFTSGKAGMMYAHNWYNVILANYMSTFGGSIADARDKILICDPPAGKTGHFGGQANANYYRGWCIKNGMSVERLEKCLELMDFLYSPKGIELYSYGVEGEHWEWVDDEVGGDRRTLVPADGQGFVQALRWTDGAAFISYLGYLPPESNALLTNGDILIERGQKTMDNMVLPDYLELQTESMTKYLSSAYDFFDETVIDIMSTKKLAATWTFDAKTWKNDWKTKLYSVSSAMQDEWDDFVDSFLNEYWGKKMNQEYNAAVQTGNYQKSGT